MKRLVCGVLSMLMVLPMLGSALTLDELFGHNHLLGAKNGGMFINNVQLNGVPVALIIQTLRINFFVDGACAGTSGFRQTNQMGSSTLTVPVGAYFGVDSRSVYTAFSNGGFTPYTIGQMQSMQFIIGVTNGSGNTLITPCMVITCASNQCTVNNGTAGSTTSPISISSHF